MSEATAFPCSQSLDTMDLTSINTIRTLAMDGVQAATLRAGRRLRLPAFASEIIPVFSRKLQSRQPKAIRWRLDKAVAETGDSGSDR
jgi:hypothetical protein